MVSVNSIVRAKNGDIGVVRQVLKGNMYKVDFKGLKGQITSDIEDLIETIYNTIRNLYPEKKVYCKDILGNTYVVVEEKNGEYNFRVYENAYYNNAIWLSRDWTAKDKQSGWGRGDELKDIRKQIIEVMGEPVQLSIFDL